MTNAGAALTKVFRESGARMHAALVRRVHDLDLAEDALQEAMIAALEKWGEHPPDDVAAWLVRTAFNKAIDRIRRSRLDANKRAEIARTSEGEAFEADFSGDPFAEDDRLRLIFLCCHPALPFESQVALTLRTVSCLTTEEIARAFLVPEPTMAQRIARAKAKIRTANIPFRTPEPDELAERVDAALAVVYLVFNEGYAATRGDTLVRADMCEEALQLATMLTELLPESGECAGLLALLNLTDARRATRVDEAGDIVLLEDQDRSKWNAEKITRGLSLVERAIRLGPSRHMYTLQAAISAVHARAKVASDTEWSEIAGIYALLRSTSPSPIIDLNHAVAVAMSEGPEAGLVLIEEIREKRELLTEHLFHAARADLLRRAGRNAEAIEAYDLAASLATNEPERRFLEKRARGTREKIANLSS